MWRFAQISDPHLASSRDGVWNNRFLCSMMPEVMACLREDLEKERPEFLLVTGDLCSRPDREAVYEARDMLDALGVPYYPSGGNHDFHGKESRAWFLDAYRHRLPAADTVYAFAWHGARFCVLDPWWRWPDGSLMPVSPDHTMEHMEDDLDGLSWGIPPEQFSWLESVLRSCPKDPVFVISHYPAIPIPDRLRAPWLQDGGCLDNGDLLVDLLSAHPNALGVISGHVHLHFIERAGEIWQITTGALPEYPVEYRIFEVWEDRVEVFTRGLSDSRFAARSLMPGRDQTRGMESDRHAVIPFRW
ncbi:MAG TPA: metallophosphoesterase [Candidatus Hydrogenedentes bacterium]|nr:metallophosphoesterase [Candidatus Hydrogenedentota bacterium]